ncbi:MAG: RpiB/LacA/LacB family sugar-phosphate isomerase [Phycisphaerae bacterium]|nr:RpiB/LacA/LacB family sugar-phosphate isomerase [Phycisphaerae bacterium]
MKMAIASTRAGLTLKDELIAFLTGLGHKVDDLGMKVGGEFVPYYESAARVAAAVSRGEYPRAIVVCGTGAGSAIVANKFKNVYAVHASSEYEGRRATMINNANILALGEWVTPPQHAKEIVKGWLDATFGEGFEPDWQGFLAKACEEVKTIEARNMA